MRRTLAIVLLLAACQRGEDKQITPVGSGSGSGSAAAAPPPPPPAPRTPQVEPPVDLKTPPADAIRTASGLVIKKLDGVATGEPPQRNDTVLLTYTGWRQASGETFFSNRERTPMAMSLANTAPGFTEAMQMLRVGERAILWLAPSIGYKGDPPPGAQPETLVYEVEIAEIQVAPPVPSDLAKPVGKATKLPGNILSQVVRAGTGKEKPRAWDTVTFNYTAWDQTGRMFDSTEMRKRAATVPVFRQSQAMETMLTSIVPGSRVRFWVDAAELQKTRPIAGMPEGLIVYDLELLTIQKNPQPPAAPPDVAAPPADAKVTAQGVAYKVVRAGKGGAKPTLKDTIKVTYSGWTTDGRLHDSSVIKGAPAVFSLQGVIAGWADAIPLMSVGDTYRLWVPEKLAYAGAPNKPQGMLVFDVELVDIVGASPDTDGHGHDDTDGTAQ